MIKWAPGHYSDCAVCSAPPGKRLARNEALRAASTRGIAKLCLHWDVLGLAAKAGVCIQKNLILWPSPFRK